MYLICVYICTGICFAFRSFGVIILVFGLLFVFVFVFVFMFTFVFVFMFAFVFVLLSA